MPGIGFIFRKFSFSITDVVPRVENGISTELSQVTNAIYFIYIFQHILSNKTTRFYLLTSIIIFFLIIVNRTS